MSDVLSTPEPAAGQTSSSSAGIGRRSFIAASLSALTLAAVPFGIHAAQRRQQQPAESAAGCGHGSYLPVTNCRTGQHAHVPFDDVRGYFVEDTFVAAHDGQRYRIADACHVASVPDGTTGGVVRVKPGFVREAWVM